MASAAASDGTLVPAGGTQMQMGPCLVEGMGEANMVAALNSWGTARDYELGQLKSDLGATQAVVSAAFDQAKDALFAIVADFRVEAASLRHDGQVDAAQSLSRLELVVSEARARFD